MKKNHVFRRYISFVWRKAFKVMKLTVLLVLLGIFTVSAKGYGQEGNISFKMGNVFLEDILRELKTHSNFTFVYSDQHIEGIKVDFFEVKDASLEAVMDKCLKGTNLEFYVDNDVVVIRKKEPPVIVQREQVKKKIKGQVVDVEGNVLPGVSVVVKGAMIGAATDKNGEYQLEISTDVKFLVFSFVGMKTLEIEYTGQSVINVKLEVDLEEVEEIVVTGIVEREKKSFTGATITVTGEELKTIGNSNILESLKTLDPSFLIVENNNQGSNPNALPNVEVRGKSAVSTDNLRDEFGNDPNQPLFILDGFESNLRTIIDLDMNQVKSITILKDATSTALYGAQAANGVIVIETVKPTLGKLKITYNADFRLEMPDLTAYNLMNSTQKLEYERLSGLWTQPNNFAIEQAKLDKYYNATLAEIRRGVDTYWLNEPLQVGKTLGHSLYVNGGAEDFSYGVGVNYKDNKGLMIGSDRKTWGVRFNLNYRKGNLNIANTLYIDGSDANDSAYGSFSKFAKANPYFRKTDEDGNITQYLDIENYWGDKYVNPLYDGTLNLKDNSKNLGLRNNLRAIWKVNRQFKIQSNFQLGQGTTTTTQFTPPEHSDFKGTSYERKGRYSNTRLDQFSYSFNLMASYAKVFKNKHSINANVRGEAVESNNESLGFVAIGFPAGTSGNPSFAFSYKENSKPVSSHKLFRRVNFLSSFNYVYDQKYLLDFTYRIDGSTTFGTNKKYSPFWALGAGWNLHNEFEINKDIVSMLKLRGSIGSTGNQSFGSLSTTSIYSILSQVNIFGQGAELIALANPDLEWQSTLDVSVGVDVSLLKNRINATFNVYNKKTDPLIVKVDLPSSTGILNYPINTGFMETNGLEAILRVSPIYNLKENIVWTLGFTASVVEMKYGGFNNTLESLNDKAQKSKSLLRYKDGASPDDIWAVPSLGIDPANGSEVFLTQYGMPTYDYDPKDVRVMGNVRPDIEGVISSNFRLKSFTLGLNLRYRFGGDRLNTALFNKVENISSAGRIDNQDVRALTDRWSKVGDVTGFKSITQFGSTPLSSRFIQKENIISGESINLGYEFKDQKWITGLGLSRLRLNAYMNDIFRISSIKEERGIDYPFARAVSFSLNANF